MTESVTLTGTLMWAMVSNPDPLYNDYRVTLLPDEDSLKKVMDLQTQGVKNTLRKDDDNKYNIIYRRRHETEMKGKKVVLGPPKVFNADGKTLLEGLIGNGSKGAIKLEVYPHRTPRGGQAKAARLESIRVDELIPFVSSKDEVTMTNPIPF